MGAFVLLLLACGDDGRARVDAGPRPDAGPELPSCLVPDIYPDVQSALDMACATVDVRTGTYEASLIVEHNVVIEAYGEGDVVLDGGGDRRVIEITEGARVRLVGLIIQNGRAPSGAGIDNTTNGRLLLRDTIVRDSVATGDSAAGGGIHSDGPVLLDHATVSGNQVLAIMSADGGGIAGNGDVTLDNGSVVEGNAAVAESDDDPQAIGGGIYTYAGKVTLIGGSAVKGNRAEAIAGAPSSAAYAHGGGILAGEVELAGASELSGNRSLASGDNSTWASSGGLSAATVAVTEDSRVGGNEARATGPSGNAWGGGIVAEQIAIDSADVFDCVASGSGTGWGWGGAIHARTQGTASIQIRRARLSGNQASQGGAIWAVAEDDGELTLLIDSSLISANQAVIAGGAIYGDSVNQALVTIDLVNSTVTGNSVSGEAGEGGAIYLGAFKNEAGSPAEAQLDLFNVTMVGNLATDGEGGAIALGRSGIDTALAGTAASSIVYGNSAAVRPNLSCNAGDDIASFVSRGYNLFGATTGCSLTGDTGDDQTGVDPMLANLGDHGGRTETLIPAVGSPAIGGGNPAGCLGPDETTLTSDQRGLPRPVGVCDVGAVEVQRGR